MTGARVDDEERQEVMATLGPEGAPGNHSFFTERNPGKAKGGWSIQGCRRAGQRVAGSHVLGGMSFPMTDESNEEDETNHF